MLKIKHLGCHGNGGEDKNKICSFLFITRQKLKVGKVSGNSIFFFFFFFFYFQPILRTTENDS